MYTSRSSRCLVSPPHIPKHNTTQGRFTPLREWLQAKVHRQGSLPESLDALLVSATGKPLDPKIFVAYLEKKYAALYDLDGAGGATAGKGEL